MSKLTKPGIVFAHGLWADGSCFQIALLPNHLTPGISYPFLQITRATRWVAST
jgi:hypothetical protein